MFICKIFICLITKLAMATEDDNLDSGGTFESGIEQGVVTKDNVTKEGESGNTTDFDPLSGKITIEGGQESSTNGNNQSIIDLFPSEPKSGQENSLCNPSDCDTHYKICGSEEDLSSDHLIIDEPKSRQKDRSHDPNVNDNDSNSCASILSKDELTLASSPYVSDSSSMIPRETNTKFLEKGEENLLQGKLLSLNLSGEDIHFILEQGDKFLERPLLLATRLKINPDIAKASIEALKCFKCEKPTDHISEHDRVLIEECLKENPQYSTPEDISLLTDVPLQTVALYLQDRPLNDKQKTDIKKKVDIGNSVREIAILLRLSPKKVQEYVDKTFLTFTGVEGKRCFDIIHKNFGYSSTFQLRKLVLTNDLNLLDQLCFILLKRNEREHAVLKKYFQKFDESKSYFEIKPTYHLTFDDILQINQSSDIEHLSIKLNKPASIIRDYLAQYKPNQLVKDQCNLMQKFRLQEHLANYGMKQRLPFHSYRMIVTHPFEDMMELAQTRKNPLQVFEELLPLAFYYLKCSLPFTEINQMFVSTGKSKLTTHELFHLIFQQSDPVLKAFCIEHYAFSNPVPFYYPNLFSVNLNQISVDFAFCSELWYSIQQYNGLISFGLGRASWNPIGKSHLLDLIFETDFVKGNPQNSAFHHNSIDVQMTNNLFGETQHANESFKWAFIDCNGHSNRELIKLICQQLNIALIHVCFQDYQNHKERFRKEVSTLTNSIKHVYLFIRDYIKEEVNVDMTNEAYKLIYIPNLTKPDVNIDSVRQSVRNIGYEILHLNLGSSKTLGNEFIEKVMTKMDHTNLKEILVEKSLVRKILECVPKSTQKLDFSFLHYYPLFVDHMNCYYQASYETDQKIIDALHSESKLLKTRLSNARMGEIVKHFSRMIKRENSSLIMWKKIHESRKKFQEAIIRNVDSYLELSVEQKESTFEQTWTECFEDEDYIKEEVERNETFERLYSLFKMEFRAMENKTEILNVFRTERYQMENIISIMQNEILCGFFQDPNVQGEKHFIFPIQEHNIPLRAMTPFPTKSSCQYLAPDCIYRIVTERSNRKTKIKLLNEIPSQCKSLVKYCSGYYNYPDVQWKGWRMDKQIFYLASQLKSPRNLHMSTWQLLIEDIDTVKKFIDIDPTVSPVTIKEIINHLYSIFQVVNYELSFIQARLTNTAERTISKLVFAYAFKSLWETKQQNRYEHDLKKETEKQGLLQYFIQKIEVRKMFRRGLDRKAMKETDLKFSQKFALDLLGAVNRGVVSVEQPYIESSFNEREEELSHKNLLLCGNAKLLHELNCNPGEDNTNSDNFVVRYICNRNVELRKLFFQKWEDIHEQVSSQLVTETTNKFNKQLEPLKIILKQLLVDIVESRDKAGSSENKAFDSDSNFEIVNMETCKFDSEIEIKESPFKAMVIFLQMYLDPNISPEEFAHFFQNEFEVDGVKMKPSDTYKLCIKSINNPNHILDQEMFKRLNDTTMFISDNIFNIFDYVTQFLSILNQNSFKLKEEEDYMKIVKSIKENFERDAIGCPNRCPSCGKLCERELHPNDGLCQIKTGHQICSMGGKVWNNDEEKTAVLHMCDDYQDNTNVVIQGGTVTWERFKNKWGDKWDWTMPEDEHYVNLQKNNRQIMKNIWNGFGKGILYYHYLCNGISISFIPYTASHDLFNRLTRQYFICFVIDGTVSMATEIKKTRISVGQFIDKYQELAQTPEFKVVIYRDHCDKHVVETFPKHRKFTTQHNAVQDFLSSVQAVGGGDYPEAVLDGLATAATESNWEYTPGVENLIIHIYDAPPHGNFPKYTLHDPKSNKKHCCCCNHGTCCHFDWDKDVWGSFKKFNIHYYGINTGKRIPEFETTMKAKLGDLCGEFQTVGNEVVNDAVLQIFIRT